jgi:hypothetical protein
MNLTTHQLRQIIKEELMEMSRDLYKDPGMRRQRSFKDKFKGNQGPIDVAYVEELAGYLRSDMQYYTSGGSRYFDINIPNHDSNPEMRFNLKIMATPKGYSTNKFNPIVMAKFIVRSRIGGPTGIEIPIPLSSNPRADAELIEKLRTQDPDVIEAIKTKSRYDWIESFMPGFPERYM